MTTHHCRVEIANGRVLSEFATADAPPSPSEITSRVWNRDYGYVEALAATRADARTAAKRMREKVTGLVLATVGVLCWGGR